MKIILMGITAFLVWTALSNYVYVCKIKKLCNQTVPTYISVSKTDSDIYVFKQKSNIVEPLPVPGNMVVYFDFDKSEFNSINITKQYCDQIKSYLNINNQVGINITGHTDNIGTKAYNQALGLRRAQSAKHYFETQGFNTNKLLIISMGETEPAQNNSTKKGREYNRRVVITFKK